MTSFNKFRSLLRFINQNYTLYNNPRCYFSAGSINCGGVSGGGYLREAYRCDAAWARRLESPLLQKVQADDLYFQIDKKFQTDQVLSAIDVDIYVNKVTDYSEVLDEIEELIYRLRKSPATADTLPSTSHAIIRAFLESERTEDLLRILDDRMNYGVFVDFHIANVLMDEFLKRGNPRDAARVASLLMLEEDFGPPTTTYLALVSCLKSVITEVPKSTQEEASASATSEETKEAVKEEVTKVRVRYLRNPYHDLHFDLSDRNAIVGKTLYLLGKQITDPQQKVLSNSAQLIGHAMFGRWDRVQNLLKENRDFAQEAVQMVVKIINDTLKKVESSGNANLPPPHELPYLPGSPSVTPQEAQAYWTNILKYPVFTKSYLENLASTLTTVKSQEVSLISAAELLLSSALSELEDKEINAQENIYQSWEVLRTKELDKQLKRFRTAEVLDNVQDTLKVLKEKEEVIFFFDKEEEWMMRLPADEQQGYKLSETYRPTNWDKFVKVIPPKKTHAKKKKRT